MSGFSIRQLRQDGLPLVYGALLLCVAWLFLFFMIENAHEQSVSRIEQTNDQLARGLEEHVRRSLFAVEEEMELIRSEYERNGVSPVIRDYFGKVSQNPVLHQILLLDEQGKVLASAKSGPAELNFADRPYFTFHSQSSGMDRLFISEPIVGRVTGTPVVALSRRLKKNDGKAGVIVMAVDAGYFSRFYQDMQLQPGQIVRVIGTDAIVRASSNRQTAEVGARLDKGYLFTEMLPQRPVGRYYTPGRTFGTPRYFSYRTMPDYPLIVQVGYDVEPALAEYRERRNSYLGAAIISSLLIILFSGLALVQQRRERRSQQRWQQVLEGLNDGIWDWDAASDWFFFSARCMEMIGYPAQNRQMSATEWRQRYHPEDAERLEQARRNHLSGQSELFDEVIRIRCQNGEYKWIRSRGKAQRDETGCLLRVMGVLTDIHAEKTAAESARKAETALAESREKYKAVMEQAFEAVVLINPETWEIIEVNQRFSEWFGYHLPEDAPLHRSQILFEGEESQTGFDSRLSSQGFLPAERRRFRHKNGSALFMERSAILIQHQEKKLIVVTYRNIAEQLQQEQSRSQDAAIAQRIQKAQLLSLPTSEYVQVDTVFQPYAEISGDLYHLEWVNDGRLLRGYLVDAPGHGLSTALYTSTLKVLLHEVSEQDASLPEQVRWLNRQICRYFESNAFAAAIAFEVDLQLREVRYVGAGITRFWVDMSAGRGPVQVPGLYLGIDDQQSYSLQTLPLTVGDRLCFATDGLEAILLATEGRRIEDCGQFSELIARCVDNSAGKDDIATVCIQILSLPEALMSEGWPKRLRLNGFEDYRRFKGEVAKVLTEVTGQPHSLPEVAVNEAIANALECRDGKARNQRAILKFSRFGNRFVVRVRTSRIGFAGNAVLRRLRANPESLFAFGEDASMGRGIPLMLSLSDWMTYNHDGTEVLLAWKTDKGDKNG